MTMRKVFLLSLLFSFKIIFSQNYTYQIGLLKYGGGGDWYANLETSLPNLIKFCNENLKTKINPEQAIVEVGSTDLFKYPLVHITGHGNIIFSDCRSAKPAQVFNRRWLLEISDNYGLENSFVRN